MKRIASICALVALVFICYVLYFLFFTDSFYTQKNTVHYFLAIHSETIRNCPIIQAKDLPLYYYRCRDGNALCANGVFYESIAPFSEIFNRVSEYLTVTGFKVEDTKDAPEHTVFKKENLLLVVNLKKNENNTEVQVIQYYP